jgi:hypothetical protein
MEMILTPVRGFIAVPFSELQAFMPLKLFRLYIYISK